MSAHDAPQWQEESTPVLPHLAAEFLLWLWWSAAHSGCRADLGEELGSVDFWVDDRLAFRTPDEGRAAAVITGENPAESPEARAAIAGGKVLRELRLCIRREEREFAVTLKAPNLDLAQVSLPQVVTGDGEEALYDRMFLYEELHSLVAAFFQGFAIARATGDWDDVTAPSIRRWVGERTQSLDG
jgi:hypothetical protein